MIQTNSERSKLPESRSSALNRSIAAPNDFALGTADTLAGAALPSRWLYPVETDTCQSIVVFVQLGTGRPDLDRWSDGGLRTVGFRSGRG
ncbi:uncharacterized protein A4U43_C05F16610 [Asparagus officinalis]|uniref:Uncharacterized protein n=1 Tax=Asparagus officinalis TaxID=4686 RepID=A0A5P1ES20_ASPOF|nr:uncharacterized protein A4U43_C05F16610 [Asparagus officinalis]